MSAQETALGQAVEQRMKGWDQVIEAGGRSGKGEGVPR